MTIRTATGLIAWYMRACKFNGWTSFWNTIYVLPGHEHDRKDEIILPTSDCYATSASIWSRSREQERVPVLSAMGGCCSR